MSEANKVTKRGNALPAADFEGDDFEAIMDRACEIAGLERIECPESHRPFEAGAD